MHNDAYGKKASFLTFRNGLKGFPVFKLSRFISFCGNFSLLSLQRLIILNRFERIRIKLKSSAAAVFCSRRWCRKSYFLYLLHMIPCTKSCQKFAKVLYISLHFHYTFFTKKDLSKTELYIQKADVIFRSWDKILREFGWHFFGL